ncbi:hypothetical protein ACPJHQ_10895 [Rossellomorea sp. H39__3]
MIRTLEDRDYSQSLQLSEYAFQYKLSEEERERRREQMRIRRSLGSSTTITWRPSFTSCLFKPGLENG